MSKEQKQTYLLSRRADLLGELNHIQNGKAGMPAKWGNGRIKQIECELEAINNMIVELAK